MSEFIAHYGVKGQKWGVVNEEENKPEQKKESLEDYKSKTDHYKDLRDQYSSKLSNLKEKRDQYLDDLSGISDRNALMKQIAKYNEVAGYYNSLEGKLTKLDGVIANREKSYSEKLARANKVKKTKTKKAKTEKETIKPTGKFYKPTKRNTNQKSNISDLVKDLQSKKNSHLAHHGIEGQKWGVRNGPPYPINRVSGSLKEQATQIVEKISAKVEADSKPPTGNQNCQLCTWCAEANFRGINALPRPVYSPMDPELSIQGVTIVKNPVKVKAKSYTNLEKMLDSIDGNARYYAHVNWLDSAGGHEFLIIKSDNKNYIMDAQAGTVNEMSRNDFHLKDINWNNSYFSRLDNKEFNKSLFEQTNDPKQTLPWNTERDTAYMYKEGMISKEEYEAVLKDPSILES